MSKWLETLTGLFGATLSKTMENLKHKAQQSHDTPPQPVLGGNNYEATRKAVNNNMEELQRARQEREMAEKRKKQTINTNIQNK